MRTDELNVSLNRRGFVAALTSAATAIPIASQQQQQPPTAPAGVSRRPLVPDIPPFEGTLEFARHPLTRKAEPFPMAQVKLLPNSIFHDANEWNSGYMARLSADRLLYTFRANAG